MGNLFCSYEYVVHTPLASPGQRPVPRKYFADAALQLQIPRSSWASVWAGVRHRRKRMELVAHPKYHAAGSIFSLCDS